MKIATMEWHERDDGAAEARCPACGAAWQTVEEGEETEYVPCGHLRFAWGEYGVVYFGAWDRAGFERAYREAAAQGCGEMCENDEEIFDGAPDRSALETLSVPEIDEVFLLADEGLEGPDAIEHWFGVKR